MEHTMFLETIPDTSGYMIAGYAVAFIVMAIYLASIIVRTRNLNQDLAMLESLEAENKSKTAKAKAAKKK
jgi:hypothetical protein